MVDTYCRVCLKDQAIGIYPGTTRGLAAAGVEACGFCAVYLATIPQPLFDQLLRLIRVRAWERGDVR